MRFWNELFFFFRREFRDEPTLGSKEGMGLAHFHGTGPGYDGYESVAVSKTAGENALRAMIPNLSDLGILLAIVSGDLIEGTIMPKLLERQSRGLIQKRRETVGSLPDVEEFAAAIVQAGICDRYSSGETIYVGSTEWG
jgi:3-oxoacyl-[acyl-carrier protein] reductase